MASRRRVRIAPSILSADFSRLGEQVAEAERAGADIVHIDVMDGRFVPNITVGPLVVRALRPVTRLPLHVHLMIVEPERHIDAFARAGADLITVHVETSPHLDRALAQIREAGARPAVTLMIEEVLDQVDLILLMTVNPGFGGQEMIPSSPDRVRRLRRMLDERGLEGCSIEVDGGINEATIPEIVSAGADVLVMGSAIFGAEGGIAEAMCRMRSLL